MAVLAGVACHSYDEAQRMLEELAEVPINAKRVERLTRQFGGERVAERDAAVAAFTALPLAEKFGVPEGVAAPELAVVMSDGGRVQVRDRTRSAAAPAADADTKSATATDAPPQGHWQESKQARLAVMASVVSATDPCPEVPAAFVDARRIPRLVRELKATARQVEEAEEDAPDAAAPAVPATPADTAAAMTYRPPEVRRHTVLASLHCWDDFGRQVAQAARAAGFHGAPRKAFVADGAAVNWTLQRRHFGAFVPILDFIHALSYVYAAATAGRPFAEGWAVYRPWIQWLWAGRVDQVIDAVAARQQALGPPAPDASETSPAMIIQRTLTYLRNHRDKMGYDEYRRQGLPMTSSHIESDVKLIGRRVKGTEKFWSPDGGEAILQLRADYLSDGDPLKEFLRRRQATVTGHRPYRRAA